MGDMVKDTTDTLNAEARLLQSRIIYDVALGLFRFLGILFLEESKETYCHTKEQSTPIHCLTIEHAVVAVLACCQEVMKILAVHAEDALTVDAEKAQCHDELNGRNALLLLHIETAEGLGKTELTEIRKNIVVNVIFIVQKFVHLVNFV